MSRDAARVGGDSGAAYGRLPCGAGREHPSIEKLRCPTRRLKTALVMHRDDRTQGLTGLHLGRSGLRKQVEQPCPRSHSVSSDGACALRHTAILSALLRRVTK
jgi:hypothetical protein